MQISVQHDVAAVRRQLLYLQNTGIRRAASVALNDTAFAARKDVQRYMPEVLDRPTRNTLGAVWVERARPNQLWAEVTVEGNPRDSARRYAYLRTQIEGGARPHKRMEKLLIAQGLLGAGEYLVPSTAQPLDSYGNVPRQIIQKILANLRAQFDPHQNTPRGGARGGRKKGEYFFTRKGVRGARLTAVWRRTPAGNAVPAFIVVARAPLYRRRLPFRKIVAGAIASVWPVEFERQVLREIRR